MPKLSTLIGKESSSKYSFLFKGPPGSGKTIAAVTAAAVFGEVWLAYFDKNEPIELINFFKTFRPELFERITFDTYGSSNANEYLNKLIDFKKNGCRYDVLITDGVTSLTSAAINWSLSFRPAAKTAINDVNIPDFDDYKVETSLVTQSLDICKSLDVVNIWTAHPIPRMEIEADGARVKKIKKSNSIVSYGSKVGGMIPGAFHEIYHFSREGANGRVVWTDTVGDEVAKTCLSLPRKIDVTGKLFFEEWKRLVDESNNKSLSGGTIAQAAQKTSKW